MDKIYIDVNESSDNVVQRIIDGIFKHKELDGYTFFAHNLGRFDSLFLIKAAVLMDNIEIKPVWKDNAIISITIKQKNLNRQIKILDSIRFIDGSLRDILNTFNCNIKKDYFPYNFVNKNNFFYVGNKPDIKYFSSVPLDIYNQIGNNWDLKNETLSYLESDICGLLEAMS